MVHVMSPQPTLALSILNVALKVTVHDPMFRKSNLVSSSGVT